MTEINVKFVLNFFLIVCSSNVALYITTYVYIYGSIQSDLSEIYLHIL